jgi:hypothetical protein
VLAHNLGEHVPLNRLLTSDVARGVVQVAGRRRQAASIARSRGGDSLEVPIWTIRFEAPPFQGLAREIAAARPAAA